MVKFPIPVLAAALYIFTAAGGPAPAGTPNGYVIALVGLVQVPGPAQTIATLVTVDAVVTRVCTGAPVVNCVDVMVMFHPAPDPVWSWAERPAVYVGVWSEPF